MTLTTKFTALAAAAALLASGAAIALDESPSGTTPQLSERGERHGKRDRNRQQKHDRMREHAKKRLESLGLDERSTARLQEVMTAARDKATTARAAVKAERDTLRTLVESGAGEAALEAQLRKLQDAQAAMPSRGAFLDETRSFLTAEQQARLVLAFSERGGKHRRR